MDNTVTAVEALTEAAAIVNGGWCQRIMACDRNGLPCAPVTNFCALGGIEQAAGGDKATAHEAQGMLAGILTGEDFDHQRALDRERAFEIIVAWNDDGERTKAEVVAALKEAARWGQMSATAGINSTLREAAALIERREWCQGADAMDAYGSPVPTRDDGAVAWCAVGALGAVNHMFCELAAERLAEYLGVGVSSLLRWNDNEGQTKDAVVATMREAAGLIRRRDK